MSIEQEIIQVLSQLPAAIEKALLDVLVLRHPGHPNQKVHGNRFGGFEATKESLRRLKDDKGAREKYKESARGRNPKAQARKLKTEREKRRASNQAQVGALQSKKTELQRVMSQLPDSAPGSVRLKLAQDFSQLSAGIDKITKRDKRDREGVNVKLQKLRGGS
jgi:hypothetical protein